jgi:hypothetical protein
MCTHEIVSIYIAYEQFHHYFNRVTLKRFFSKSGRMKKVIKNISVLISFTFYRLINIIFTYEID